MRDGTATDEAHIFDEIAANLGCEVEETFTV
jgi:hypothetical protein